MSSVSVVIPCYGYAHFLPECVGSVLAQTGVSLRVLILDDASPDDMPAVAAALAADPRVEYRRHSVNQGHIATYNEGLAWASGDYTLLISADDLLTSGALGRAAALLDAHPNLGFVYGAALPFYSGQPLPRARTPAGLGRARLVPGRDWFRAAYRQAHVYIMSPEVVVRTTLQHELGGYAAQLPHTADLAMWLRFALRADVGQLTQADQAYYRYHPNNLHKALAPTRYHDLRHRQAAFEAALSEYPGHDAPALRQALARRLARAALAAAGGALAEKADGAAQAAELIQYAFALDPGAAWTAEYWGLQAERRLGPAVLPLLRAGHRRLFAGWAHPLDPWRQP